MKLRDVAVCMLAAVMAAACGDDDDVGLTPVRLTELATVTALEPMVELEVCRPSGEWVTLTTTQRLNGAEVGQRIAVSYQAAPSDTVLRPVPVTITGASAITWGEVVSVSAATIASHPAPHYEILSQWQTGRWLNFQMKVRCGDETSFTLVADQSTLAADEVECHFVGAALPEGNAYIDRRTFASFDISGILQRPGQKIVIKP